MELPDDVFTPITNFVSDESQVKITKMLENKTESGKITMSPIDRALDELDKFVEDNDNAIEEAINGPNVHDSFKQLKIKVEEIGNTSVMPDSPRPGEKRPINLICNRYDYERTGLGKISKSCRVAIRKYIDDRKNVRFEYCPELEHKERNEVKSTQCQTDIMDPAILITLPKSQKIALTL